MRCFIIIVVCIVILGCYQGNYEPPKYKFSEGDIIEHIVWGFTAQVIEAGPLYLGWNEEKGKCMVLFFPPLSEQAVEFIRRNDRIGRGCRDDVPQSQIHKVVVRECEFELAEED